MSRFYQMSVEVSGHDPTKVVEIQAAAEQEWPFDDWYDSGENLTASGQANLSGGEGEEEFTERLSLAIWRANGRYCRVVVDATYLENLPYETHELDEADYARLIQVMVDVTVASEVLDVDEDGNVEYGEQTNEDGEVLHYICAYCGLGIPGIHDGEALREYLQTHGMLK